MSGAKAALLGSVLLAVSLAGCFGGGQPADTAPPPPPKELSQTEQRRLEQLAAPEIRNYTLPGSLPLEPQVAWFNDTVDPSANAAYQDRNDRGGNSFNVQVKSFDISAMVPPGQPTALRIKLVYFGQPGSSAKADIFACVPGFCSAYTTGNNDEFNWKATVQTRTVMTVGVPGERHEVGVAAANGKMASPLQFSLEVQATYFADVLTPYSAFAFTVPPGATGVTLRSVKPGQEHLQAKFIILDPQDELVTYTEYDDIAIVSESIFVPTRQPGEYVFYAQDMQNGFLSIVSDAPLGNDTALRVLTMARTEGTLSSGPAPGVPERDIIGGANGIPSAPTPYAEGTAASFSVDSGFPVEVGAIIRPGVTGAAEVRISSGKGEVFRFQRVLRVDTETQGSLGYTRDESNTRSDWSKLAKGSYSVSLVSDAVTGEIAYWVKTYSR